jgi:hypothetical protein
MKNIAIPLLVAGSAQAQRFAADGGLEADMAVAMPMLVAAAVHQDGCTDAAGAAAVSPAATAVDTARSELERLQGLLVAPQKAVDDQVLVKVAAVTLAQQTQEKTAIAAAIATADAAAEAERASQAALDLATRNQAANVAEAARLTTSVAALTAIA